MYFTKLRLVGLTTIDLPIIDALPSDPYILKSVTGLGPPEVDVSIMNTLNAGGFYQGRRPQTREPVVHIGLNPDYKIEQTVSDLRQDLYGLLTPGADDIVKIQIWDDIDLLLYTTGYVKKLEIAPFSKTPEVQVTISCLQQYLLSLDDLYVDPGSTSAPTITNVGTAPAGFHMEVVFSAGMPQWEITASNGDKMLFDYDFLSGDTLIFDTRPGVRGIKVLRGVTEMNILWALSSDSTWLMLHGGDNYFTTVPTTFAWGDVYYLPQYWGI
jgi:Phage tail protein